MHMQHMEKPILTHDTTAMGTVLPQVAKIHTVPVTVQPLLKIPRVYPHPCYSLPTQNTHPFSFLCVHWQVHAHPLPFPFLGSPVHIAASILSSPSPFSCCALCSLSLASFTPFPLCRYPLSLMHRASLMGGSFPGTVNFPFQLLKTDPSKIHHRSIHRKCCFSIGSHYFPFPPFYFPQA